MVEEEKIYTLTNGYVNVFQNSMRLSKGKFGEIIESDMAIEGINTENNLSEKNVEVQRPRRRPRGRYNGDRGGGGGRSNYGRGRDRNRNQNSDDYSW